MTRPPVPDLRVVLKGARGWSLLAAALLAIGLPGIAGVLFPGLPLTPVGLAGLGLALFAQGGLPAPSTRWSRLLLAGFLLVAVLKPGLQAGAPPAGFTTSYWAGPVATGPPESSPDFARLGQAATRVDAKLDLRGSEFPVHFFNDAARYNLVGDAWPSRDQLPFTVRWEGFLQVPVAGSRRFQLEAEGPARLWLDAREVLVLAPAAGLQRVEATVPLAATPHPIQVDYTRPVGRAPRLRLDWDPQPSGALVPVGQPFVYQALPDTEAFNRLPLLQNIARAVDGLLLLLLAGWLYAGARQLIPAPGAVGARSRARWVRAASGTASVYAGAGQLIPAPGAGWVRAGLAFIPLLFLFYGMALLGYLTDQATILSGGDDWLTHESSARDILLRGLLMVDSKGQSPPFYGQPLYPYWLAGGHLLTGEGLFGVYALQYALLGLTLVLTTLVGARLFGWRGGLATLALFWAFAQQEHLKVSRQLLNENLYLPLLMCSLLAAVSLARLRRPPGWARALLVGGLFGLTALARSQFLLFVPLLLIVLVLAWRRAQPAAGASIAGACLLIVFGVVVAVAPATARNWVVAGQFVPISSSASLNLYQFHEPPADFDLSSIQRDPLYETLKLDRETRIIVEYARRDPLGYLGTWVPFAAHAIGLTGLRRGDGSVYWGFLLPFGLYLITSVALPRARRLAVWPLHLFIATHLVVMAAFQSDTYGFRLVLPMYGPVIAVAAQGPLALLSWLTFRLRRSRPPPVSPPIPENSARPPLDAVPPTPCPSRQREGGAAPSIWKHLVRRRRGRALLVPAVLVVAVAGAAGAQGFALLQGWKERERNFYGLSPTAAQAVELGERAEADLVYLASGDGTPRRYGSGTLPGLRYPRIKWFDPSRSLPLPPDGARAVYALDEVADTPGLAACLPASPSSLQRVATADEAAGACLRSMDLVPPASGVAQFARAAQLDAVSIRGQAVVGEVIEARMLWRVLARPSGPLETFLHLEDGEPGSGDPVPVGNGTSQLYAASEWESGERVLSRLPVPTDPTAIPGPYRMTLGFAPPAGGGPPLGAVWLGGTGDRLPLGPVTLGPAPAPSAGQPPTVTRGFQTLANPVGGGGLQLVAVRAPPATARPGRRLAAGLLWRITDPAETTEAAWVRLLLVRPNGRVAQQTDVPVLRGRLPPSGLAPGTLVRDEVGVIVGPRAPAVPLVVRWQLLDAGRRVIGGTAAAETWPALGVVEVEARQRTFAPPDGASARPAAIFGDRVALVNSRLVPPRAKAGATVTLQVQWKALAEMDVSYKVFVHLLAAGQDQPLAQRDAEPQNGAAPTSGWLAGELVADEYRLQLPPDLSPGDYRIAIGLYDPATGDRLPLADGANRLLLETTVRVGG